MAICIQFIFRPLLIAISELLSEDRNDIIHQTGYLILVSETLRLSEEQQLFVHHVVLDLKVCLHELIDDPIVRLVLQWAVTFLRRYS